VEHDTVEMPTSKLKEGVAQVLLDEGFISDFQVVGEVPQRLLKIYLKYGPLGEKVIRRLERISKPGRRVYKGAADLGYVHNGIGIWVVSTNKGVLSDRGCRSAGVGGEVLCSVY
jgi:small subunit ribosomal protein S8